MAIEPAGLSALRMEIQINASPERVWQSLTSDIGTWWPAEFYAGGTPGRRNFVLEARPGGRMFEEWQDGGGVLWATVVGIEPKKRLQVTGNVFPNWGGPSLWFGTWELQAGDGGTRLRFEDHIIGRVSEEAATEKSRGWHFLWAVLKAELEGTPAPSWTDPK